MTIYYVDFAGGSDAAAGTSTGTAWKRCKGMTGVTGTASSTTPADGDSIVFKGGSTWTASWPWTVLGGTSSMVTYTTDHTWYSGGAFAQPIFNGDASNPGDTGIINSTAHHITFNDLKFTNVGPVSTFNQSKCIRWENCHDITVIGCTFSPECWIAMAYKFTSAGSYSNFTISGTEFTHCGSAAWVASAQASTSIHTLIYHDCTYHDSTTQIGGDPDPGNNIHGDGFIHYFTSSGAADSTEYIDGVKFYNNKAYGDCRRSFGTAGGMTAFFFVEGPMTGNLFNNDFSFTGTQTGNQFQSLILIDGRAGNQVNTLGMYNNALVSQVGSNQMSAALDLQRLGGGSAITVKNNIIYQPQYSIYLEDSSADAAYTGDYNLYNSTSDQLVASTGFKSYAAWQALGARFDPHSLLGSNPSWTAAPGDETLQAGSVCIAAGTNLSGLGITELNSDKNGVARGSSWDIGPFQYASAPPSPGNPLYIATMA